MDIHVDMEAIAKLIEEVYADEEVITAPEFKCIFNSVDELRCYLASRKGYIEYCKDNEMPMVDYWP